MKNRDFEVYVVTLLSAEVRDLCHEKKFYTVGDHVDFYNMLSHCGRGLKPSDILNIAQDIVDHTDPDNEWIAPYQALDEVVHYLQDLLKVEVMCHTLAPEKPEREVRWASKIKAQTKRKVSTKMNVRRERFNENWSTLSYDNYGVQKPLVNESKDYTLLCHQVTGEFVVAYRYNSTDNTWSQGHYFHDYRKALEFMYAPEVEDHSEERKICISNAIPGDWFDADQLKQVVDEVYDALVDVPEIDEGCVIDVLKQFGYCD